MNKGRNILRYGLAMRNKNWNTVSGKVCSSYLPASKFYTFGHLFIGSGDIHNK